ncbi:hypothetical protein V6N11_070393 [Hibiscus sabdariffa]|uniref:MATH domain-containing protein n=1 Tax=Hibiscus sabdariffa TaxID=183260 RepID=A0ABR2QEU2_9ROSI
MFENLSAVNSRFGSILPQVIWRVEVLKAVDGAKSESKDGNGEISKVTWRIPNFSSFTKDEELFSEHFSVDGNKWQLSIYPKGSKGVDHLSIYLEVADSATLPSGWTRFAQYGFAVIDQVDRTNSITEVATDEFNAAVSGWSYPSFIALSELEDPKRGYILNDACLIEAYISTDRTEGLISRQLILETDSDKHKTKEADCVKAAIDNQKTVKTKPVEITTPSPTQPSCQIVVIEPAEPTEEDIKTFFTSLESELSSSDTVFSKEEAKEALAKLDEALNMTPANFYSSGKFSSLKQAFKILASFDCSSTTLTIKQKNKLLAMEESIKELAGRADKAKQDKNHLTEKESTKLTLTRTLDRNVIRYKEVESEVKQIEQKLAVLHEQLEEAQKKRGNMLAEREGIFKSSKEMKVELDALGKEWSEYEANAKVAEEEAKTVEAEWGRMKCFISAIKQKI